ncbi:MAG: competence/damage-inducible protein A [Planctomycetota bacterium]|jgi:molybdenum cofactor synthesis domain-containing protein
MQSAAALIIGDEILTGEIEDANGPFLVKILNDAGVRVTRKVTVPDDKQAIVTELSRLRALADAVVISGGIGPTHDDVTRPAVAEAVGVELVRHEEADRRIRGFYAGRITEAELAMALMPRGCRLLHGQRTPTFGFGVCGIYVLPGVPTLFRDIARGLTTEFETRPLHRAELITRRREGEIAPRLADVQGRALDVAIGSYPVYEDGKWHVRVVLRAPDAAALERTVEEVRSHLE